MAFNVMQLNRPHEKYFTRSCDTNHKKTALVPDEKTSYMGQKEKRRYNIQIDNLTRSLVDNGAIFNLAPVYFVLLQVKMPFGERPVDSHLELNISYLKSNKNLGIFAKQKGELSHSQMGSPL